MIPLNNLTAILAILIEHYSQDDRCVSPFAFTLRQVTSIFE